MNDYFEKRYTFPGFQISLVMKEMHTAFLVSWSPCFLDLSETGRLGPGVEWKFSCPIWMSNVPGEWALLREKILECCTIVPLPILLPGPRGFFSDPHGKNLVGKISQNYRGSSMIGVPNVSHSHMIPHSTSSHSS